MLRWIFFALLVRPLTWIVLGFNVRHKERLPIQGPAVLAANHNSHLDTLALMSLFPLHVLPKLHPVAAEDYFLKTPLLRWFSLNLMGILPIPRKITGSHEDPIHAISKSLQHGDILIFFPEGTRGEPEQLSQFKSGIAHLARRLPEVPVVPVFLHGLGKALPRGEAVLVPFFCDVFVGEPLFGENDKKAFLEKLEGSIKKLGKESPFAAWE